MLMNRLAYIISLTLLVMIPVSLTGQQDMKPMSNPALFSDRLIKASSAVNSITSDFVQEKNLSVLNEKIISKGRFAFKKENNIRWEYTEPYRYLIIISNNQMFMRDEKNKKQIDIQSNPMFREMNRFITGCIQGDILKNENEYSKEFFENDKYYYVKLIPKSDKVRQMLNEVHIWFNRVDMGVEMLKMVESGNDYTQIMFTGKILNPVIPVEKFSFN